MAVSPDRPELQGVASVLGIGPMLDETHPVNSGDKRRIEGFSVNGSGFTIGLKERFAAIWHGDGGIQNILNGGVFTLFQS